MIIKLMNDKQIIISLIFFIFVGDHSTCSEYYLPYQDVVGAHPTLLQMIDIVALNGGRPKHPIILMEGSMVRRVIIINKY